MQGRIGGSTERVVAIFVVCLVGSPEILLQLEEDCGAVLGDPDAAGQGQWLRSGVHLL